MRKFLLSIIVLTTLATEPRAQIIEKPEVSLSLEIINGGGANGAGVAYNPDKKLYYAGIAGNALYPLEVFDEQGKNLYQTQAGFDLRGFWYNPKERSLDGNSHSDYGFYRSKVDNLGYPNGVAKNILAGKFQPDHQSIGAYISQQDLIVYLKESELYFYSFSDGTFKKSLPLLSIPASLASINYTTVIYTGHRGYEFAILNYVAGEIYFFNKKGKYMATAFLPKEISLYDVFNFSYAHNCVWLFDTGQRIWYGYKLFQ